MISLFKHLAPYSVDGPSAELFDARTKELLASYYPNWQTEIIPGKIGSSTRLPVDDDAEYSFILWGYEDGEKQIHAQRKGHSQEEYFYYYPFELADFRDDVSLLSDEFNKKLEIILSCDTRVRQYVGVLWASFHCEYFSADQWKPLGCVGSCLRWGFILPPAPIYRTIYCRGPKGRMKHQAAKH